MRMIERYLAAVRRDLPGRNAADIVAELREELSDRLEERAERSGRAPSVEDELAVIRDFGHPLVVAGRFRTHQHLIGPDVFPFFLFTARITVGALAALLVILLLLSGLQSPQVPWRSIGEGIGDAMLALLTTFGGLTIIFAILERAGFPKDHLSRWRPDHLPQPSGAHPPSWQAPFEAAMAILMLLWWTGVVPLTSLAGADHLRLHLGPAILALYWPVALLLGCKAAVALAKWQRPGARWWHLADMAIAGASILLLALLYPAGHWISVAPANRPEAAAESIEKAVNLALSIGLPATAAILLFTIFRDARDWLRSRSGP